MRLLNVHVYRVEEFLQREIPPYAILSHTWDKEEVTLQDLGKDYANALLGFRKIDGCCKQAQRDGFDYVWVDTCCIDKTSSAELSEAINSMFKWYSNAEICYAYLQDVTAINSSEDQRTSLTNSRWFTRGWTLQELIAPVIVLFFAEDWSEIGSRATLVDGISLATGIDRAFFQDGNLSVSGTLNRRMLSHYSVAQKMSWASRRKTSRLEDEAYCLLGLFGVNMPLLYGEGSMAFIRLQEEIMKRSSDYSIFAWNPRLQNSGSFGVLANSPSLFEGSGNIVEVKLNFELPPFGITNKGIQITLPIMNSASFSHDSDELQTAVGIRFVVSAQGQTYLAFLPCAHSSSRKSLIALSLEQQEGLQLKTNNDVPYFRKDRLRTVPVEVLKKAVLTTVFLQSANNLINSGIELWGKSEQWPLVLVRQPPPEAAGEFRLVETWPPEVKWTAHESGMLSARFAKETESDLIFARDSHSAFCLMITCDRRTGSTDAKIVEDVPIHDPAWDIYQWILNRKQRKEDAARRIYYGEKYKSMHFDWPMIEDADFTKFFRDFHEDDLGSASISASATRRLFGAVIKLKAQIQDLDEAGSGSRVQ